MATFFRTLNVIDGANRGALGIDIALASRPLRDTFLTQMVDLHGQSAVTRYDNGRNSRVRHLRIGATRSSSSCAHAAWQTKPERLIERSNRTHREDVPSAYLFNSLEVREITVDWIARYNECRQRDIASAACGGNSSLELSTF